MTDGSLRVAVVQTAPKQFLPDANRREALAKVDDAIVNGAKLIALPECAISGYAIDDPVQAFELAETIDGPSVKEITRRCASNGVFVAFGLLEREGKKLYNSAVLVGPDGVIGRHRKAHLVRVAADVHVNQGDAIAIFEAAGIKLGMMICYEVRFPEMARVMALSGAGLIIVLANWPAGAEVNPGILTPARAAENNVHLLAANRCGTEGSLSFIGRSAIHLPTGERIARAEEGVTTLYADISPGPGLTTYDIHQSRYAVDLIGHRRPDLYTRIAEWDDRT